MDILYFIWQPWPALPPRDFSVGCTMLLFSLPTGSGLREELRRQPHWLSHWLELRFLAKIHLCCQLDVTHWGFLGTGTMVLVYVEALPPGGRGTQHLNQSKSKEILFPIPGPLRSSRNTSILLSLCTSFSWIGCQGWLGDKTQSSTWL